MERNEVKIGRYLALACLLTCLLAGCSRVGRPQVFADRQALNAFVNDAANGFFNEYNGGGGLKLRLSALPGALLPGYGKASSDSSSKNRLYFVLGISYQNKELLAQLPRDQYSGMLQTFSFGMVPKIVLVDGSGSETEPMDVFFQPTYNLGRSNDLLLVFDKRCLPDEGAIEIAVAEFGLNIGKQRFAFDAKDLRYLSTVEIEKSI